MSDNLTTLSNITLGTAGLAALQDETYADIRAALSVAIIVATRSALTALDITKDQYAFLTESGREGPIFWETGDFSAQIAADPLQGIYFESDNVDASEGAWVRRYNASIIWAKWFGAKGDAGITDNTLPINQALANLPATGGKVLLDIGIHTHTGVINFGDGNSDSISTRNGMVLIGAGQPPLPATWFGGLNYQPPTALIYTGSKSCHQIDINGPLQGWGIQNLYMSGGGVANININVSSGQFGDSRNLVLVGATGTAINSATLSVFGTVTNCDSLHNWWTNIAITCNSSGVARGIILSGRGMDAKGTNTDYNCFQNVVIDANGNGSAQGIYLGPSDSNQFHTLHFIGFAPKNAIVFDYGLTTGGAWPASNMFWGVDLGGSSVSNIGIPGSLARPNEWFGSIDTNGGNYPRNIPNLYTALPQEIYNVQLTGQTAAIGLQSAYQVRQTGMFRISYYLTITSAGTGGTLQFYVNYNDGQNVGFEQGSATLPATGGVLADAFTCECITLGAYASNEIIKWRVAFNSVTGTPAFKIRVVIERL
ncbi:hypothetical protein G6M50_05970 [Agrobacterium rhizogenes]|nr:hypothetical protein [Rhizobium rhizogenes]NTJ77349.1 hypothetical protein [Rhizobium rhizogenes]